MCFWLGTEAAFAEECWLVSGRYHFSCLFKLQKILISKHFSLHRTYLFLISAFCWHNFPFLPAGSVYGMIHQAVSASPCSPSAARDFPGELWAAGCSLSPCGRGRRKAAQARVPSMVDHGDSSSPLYRVQTLSLACPGLPLETLTVEKWPRLPLDLSQPECLNSLFNSAFRKCPGSGKREHRKYVLMCTLCPYV